MFWVLGEAPDVPADVEDFWVVKLLENPKFAADNLTDARFFICDIRSDG